MRGTRLLHFGTIPVMVHANVTLWNRPHGGTVWNRPREGYGQERATAMSPLPV